MRPGKNATLPDVAADASMYRRCAGGQSAAATADLDVAKARERAVAAASSLSAIPSSTESGDGDGAGLGGGLQSALTHAFFRTGYVNYSADYRPVATMLDNGRLEAANRYLAVAAADTVEGVADDDELAGSFGKLGLLERGSLFLAAGDVRCATRFFDYVVDDLRTDADEKSTMALAVDAVTDDYEPRGFEAVMAANYRAIAQFLQGDEGARNTIQLARAWQARERNIYEDELEAGRRDSETAVNDNDANGQAGLFASEFSARLDDSCPDCERAADRVDNPYVNPLGDFLSGAFAEQFAERARLDGDSTAYSAKKSKARAAFRNAAELNPDNAVVAQATRDLGTWMDAVETEGVESLMGRESGPLVHVVADLGRAPERKVAVLNVPIDITTVIPLQIAYYDPVGTPIASVRLETGAGETVQELRPLADVEAMVMRYFQDRRPIHVAKAAGAAAASFVAQSAVEEEAGEGLFGAIMKTVTRKAIEAATRPGTEAWMSLPKTVAVSRTRVPRDAAELRLVSYRADGREIAAQPVPLDGAGPYFIYARGVGPRLEVMSTGAGPGPAGRSVRRTPSTAAAG